MGLFAQNHGKKAIAAPPMPRQPANPCPACSTVTSALALPAIPVMLARHASYFALSHHGYDGCPCGCQLHYVSTHGDKAHYGCALAGSQKYQLFIIAVTIMCSCLNDNGIAAALLMWRCAHACPPDCLHACTHIGGACKPGSSQPDHLPLTVL